MRFRQGRDRSLSGFSGWTWAPRMLVTGQFNVCPAALATQNRLCRQELEPSRRSYVAHQTSTMGWRPRDSGLYVPRPRFAPIPSPRAQHLELFAASNQLKLQTGKNRKESRRAFCSPNLCDVFIRTLLRSGSIFVNSHFDFAFISQPFFTTLALSIQELAHFILKVAWNKFHYSTQWLRPSNMNTSLAEQSLAQQHVLTPAHKSGLYKADAYLATVSLALKDGKPGASGARAQTA